MSSSEASHSRKSCSLLFDPPHVQGYFMHPNSRTFVSGQSRNSVREEARWAVDQGGPHRASLPASAGSEPRQGLGGLRLCEPRPASSSSLRGRRAFTAAVSRPAPTTPRRKPQVPARPTESEEPRASPPRPPGLGVPAAGDRGRGSVAGTAAPRAERDSRGGEDGGGACRGGGAARVPHVPETR
jgi:hypothetical protein